MKKKQFIIIILAFFLFMKIPPVYGSTNNQSNFIHPSMSIETILKEKLGFSEKEIQDKKISGKNAFAIAKEKGVDKESLKKIVIKTKCKKIDDALGDGYVSSKLADMMKNAVKSRTEKWNGEF
jgi:hypothetical protein